MALRPMRDFLMEFFTPAEASTVDALSERILPSGQTPGASEAAVVRFIDHLLATHYAAQRQAYRDGLRCLDIICRERHGRSFRELSVGTQDALLKELEAGGIMTWPKAAEFAEMVRIHTIEGMLSDPKYGGNLQAIGWRGLL